MLLSVVIPYFNAGRYIYTAVQSILDSVSQSSAANAPRFIVPERIQIIIVNDASNDEHTTILHDLHQRCWAQSAVQVQILTLPDNKGLSGARNAGIAHAGGEYIFCLDADDFVHTYNLNKMMALLHDLSVDMLFFGSFWFEKDHSWGMQGFPFEPKAINEVSQTLIAQYIDAQTFYAWRFFAKKSLLLQVPYPDRLYMEDVATTTPLLSRAKTIWYEPDQVVYYRQNPTSIMKVWTAQKSFDFLNTTQLLKQQLVLTTEQEPALTDSYFGLSCKAYLWACADAIRHRLPNDSAICKQIRYTHINTFGKITRADWPRIIRHLDARQSISFFLSYYALPLYRYLLLAKTKLRKP